MAIYKRGKVWWYKFSFNGRLVRASSKTANRRAAEQIEAAKKTQLAKGEVGIEDRGPCPTLADFAKNSFIPYLDKTKRDKPRTIEFYKMRVSRLKTFPRLWSKALDEISQEDITAYVSARQRLEMETSTINRDLATLRRMFKLAMEWQTVDGLLPKVHLLPGENRRERVLTADEEAAYMTAAAPLLRDFAVLAIECGFAAGRGASAEMGSSPWRQHRDPYRQDERRAARDPRITEYRGDAEAEAVRSYRGMGLSGSNEDRTYLGR